MPAGNLQHFQIGIANNENHVTQLQESLGRPPGVLFLRYSISGNRSFLVGQKQDQSEQKTLGSLGEERQAN